jgi:hypothetical protein
MATHPAGFDVALANGGFYDAIRRANDEHGGRGGKGLALRHRNARLPPRVSERRGG